MFLPSSRRRPCPVPPSAGAHPVPRSGFFSCHGGRGRCFSATLRLRRFRSGLGLGKRLLRHVPRRSPARNDCLGSLASSRLLRQRLRKSLGGQSPLRKTSAALAGEPSPILPSQGTASPALISSACLTSPRPLERGLLGCRQGLPTLPAAMLVLAWELEWANWLCTPDGLPQLLLTRVPSKGWAGKSCGEVAVQLWGLGMVPSPGDGAITWESCCHPGMVPLPGDDTVTWGWCHYLGMMP